jgi:hypothetical protein
MIEAEENMLENEEMEQELDEDSGSEEIVEMESPKIVIVEFTQLKKLLQRCPECSQLPQRRSFEKDNARRYGKDFEDKKTKILAETM